jgi:hypothetical protein
VEFRSVWRANKGVMRTSTVVLEKSLSAYFDTLQLFKILIVLCRMKDRSVLSSHLSMFFTHWILLISEILTFGTDLWYL